MPRKQYKGKKSGRRPRKVAQKSGGRRRLQPAIGAVAGAYAAYRIGRRIYKNRQTYNQALARRANANRMQRIEQSDNITSLTAFKIGKQRKLSFTERVQRIERPPIIFKRNYSWSAEVESGRKAMFSIPLNLFGNGTALHADLITNFNRLTSNTANTADDVETTTSFSIATNQDYYVDYMSQYLQMVNSGSNSVIGSVELYVAKRDADFAITNVNLPADPINLMMYGSSANLTKQLGSNEQIVGNGFAFNNSSAGLDYDANYGMPGSSLNPTGTSAQVDPALEINSVHVKKFVDYYVSKIGERNFSLKPGQQVNLYTILNELPTIYRPDQEYTYLKGITYHLVVSFKAGIVGDSTLNNVISTGNGQLSCVLEEKRIIGLRTAKKTLLVMATPPLTQIAKANQQIINPDTGVVDLGYEEDS